MDDRSQILARNLASVMGARKNKPVRPLKADRTLQVLVADLVAARTAVGMTQKDVAARMGTTRSVVSRLESGVHTDGGVDRAGRNRHAGRVAPGRCTLSDHHDVPGPACREKS